MFPLFHIGLQHGFFKDQLWLNASLQADEPTQALMQRYQWQLIQQGNQWSVYSHANGNREDFLTALLTLVDEQVLRFWLRQPLPNFVTFTDLPLDWQGLLRFSSSHQHSDSAGVSVMQVDTVPFCKVPVNTIGIIEFNINDLLEQTQYCIQLQNRKTYWEYRLIQRHQVRLQQPEILDESGENSFTKLEKYTTESGEVAWKATSGEQQLPMQQVPNTLLKLVDHQMVDVHEGRSVQRTVLNALPTPRTDQIQPHSEQPTQALSVMYVYL